MTKRPVVVEVSIPFSVVEHAFLDDFVIEGWDSARIEKHTAAVCAEIEANASEFSDCEIRAIRFGKGTASVAGSHIATIKRCLAENFSLADGVPVTMQSAISNISGANMPFFKRAGVARFDFEMMSLDSATYPVLNKVDNLRDLPIICDNFLHSYANDMLGYILAVGNAEPSKKEATASFKRSVITVARSHASHLILRRAYPDDGSAAAIADEQLEIARDVLGRADFVEYIPGYFAREGKEDAFFAADYAMQPEAYAEFERVGDYTTVQLAAVAATDRLAFGLGATTIFEGVKTQNTLDLDTYLANSHNYAAITVSADPIS